jgi:hypothetical protein
MSRFLKTMIVLLAIVAMAAPAFAADNLSLSGEMRVRGWYVDNNTDPNTNSRFDQRLRIGGKFSVAEGVSVTFRTDVTESVWGTTGSGNGFGSGRSGYDGSNQWDRAHLDLNFGGFALRAGQQYLNFGVSGFDAQDNGFKIVSGPVTAFFMLNDNNGSTLNESDDYYYGVQFAMDSFAGFLASQKGDAEEVYVLGGTYKASYDALSVYFEAEYFTGDASATVDAMGAQMVADVSFAASEAMTVGGQVMYAMGADGGEAQYVILGNDFGGWDPLFDVGTSLSNEQIGAGRAFDVFGGGAGLMALRVYTSVKASDALKIGASLAYAEPEEDANTAADSLLGLAFGVSYKLMANTNLDMQVEYIDVDEAGVDAAIQGGVGLFVNF